MVSIFVFMENNVEGDCGCTFYHSNVISWAKCKTTITTTSNLPHVVLYKIVSLICMSP